MIEALATLARFAQVASGGALAGWVLFQVLAVGRPDGVAMPRIGRSALLWALCFAAAGLLALACQSALVSGRDGAALDAAEWWRVSVDTLYGRVWWLRQGLMLCALLLAWVLPVSSMGHIAVALLAALAAGTGAAAGHAAALEPAWPGLLAAGVHVCAFGLWWGGLLPLSWTLSRASSTAAFNGTLRRFSRLASMCMVLILSSGGVLAVLQVERWPALFGTRYGWLLLIKITLLAAVLALAARLRWHWMRHTSSADQAVLRQRPPKLVLMEWLVAALVVLTASVLAGTPPARHEQVEWPFDFRMAPEVALARPENLPWLIAGGVTLSAAALLVIARLWMARSRLLLPGAGLCAAAAAAMALPHLSVPAFPDTYRSSEVPYHAISIENGAALFRRYCVDCHGLGGLGDGPNARSLAVAPADLSAPHTSDHTAGDMFWWLSHGMPSGAMPGFAHLLDAEARWDLVNYLRTFSQGYQARVIRPQVAPGNPWLGAPDFNFTTRDGHSGSLKELRGHRPALLVFYTWPESAPRLRQLALAGWLPEQAQVLVIALRPGVAAGDAAPDLPFVIEGGEEAAASYLLLRRTLRNADSGDRGPLPAHMEMLIDRFGYLRARWLPAESADWQDLEHLRGQLRRLQAEPEILPPPDEHIH